MAQILLVDDSAVQRKVLRKNFEAWGHTIAGEAGSGDDALRIIAHRKPDLVTLDISMQGMDGLECLEQIHKQAPDVKVIMITALGTGDRVKQAMENGCVGFVIKPIDWTLLKNTIEKNV